MIKKHFKFTGKTKSHLGHTLHQIKAIKDLPCGVKKGDVGGWIEKESNLSDNAWVYGNARVSGNASVSGNARVYDNAWVSGNARVYDNASVYGNAHIDSLSAIIVLVIAMKWSVTITRKYIFIGCKQFTRKEIKKMTLKQAEEAGLDGVKLFKPYKKMIEGAMELVKENP